MKITFGKEKLLSQAPADTRDWGPWQFPRLFDGGDKIYLEFHISADSAKSYGNPRAWLYSDDKGETWTKCDNGALLLDNGDMVKPYQPRAIPETDISLPKTVGTFHSYGFKRDYFKYDEVPAEYRHWFIERTTASKSMIVEEVSVDLPGYTMNTSEGVFPSPYFHHFKKGPNGTLWTLLYKHFIENGKISEYSASWFHKSTDNGKTFQYVSRVPYFFDSEKDPNGAKRYGYGEPDICFIDDETAFALHRTTDGTGIGPMYITWTKDSGTTWTKPEFFDDRGVWPQTITLDNGVILAGYGRPGLFVRPYYKGKWYDRTAVVEPMEYQKDTCSYCSLIAIEKDTALIVYSDFNYPGPDGTPRKSIMARKVMVNI